MTRRAKERRGIVTILPTKAPASFAPGRSWRQCLAVAALTLVSSSGSGQQTSMSQIIPYPTRVERLDNGLTALIMPMPSNGLVAYWSIVRTGSRDEYEPGRTGFAHFFEHMMFRGTERYPADLYQEILTRIGASANAYTTDDLTAYHLSFAAEDLETVMELESDRFQHLAYDEEAFRTEAGAVYGEYRKVRTSPGFVLYEALVETAFDVHPYGHTTMGSEKDIAAMPTMYEYSREFFSRYYRPENTILFVAGDVDPQHTSALLHKHYGAWQRGYVPPVIPAEPLQEGERRIDVEYDGRTLPMVWVAYKIDEFDPEDRERVALDLLAELAFGPTSDIYKRLVLDEQVVEFLQAEAGMNRDPGLFDVYARVKDPAHVDYVLAAIDEAVRSHRSTLAEAERLTALKSRLRYGFLMQLDTPDSVAETLARPIAITGGLDSIERLYEVYDSLTAEDVRAAARAYLSPERRTVAVLRARE